LWWTYDHIVPKVVSLIKQVPYDSYVEAVFGDQAAVAGFEVVPISL
jgi:hypothetical protein